MSRPSVLVIWGAGVLMRRESASSDMYRKRKVGRFFDALRHPFKAQIVERRREPHRKERQSYCYA